MSLKALPILLIAAIAATGAIHTCAQQATDTRPSLFPRTDQEKEAQPHNLKETLEKLRIEKEKKEHQEMLDRGEEALRLSEQLEKAFGANGKLSDKEVAKIAAVEKIVKKIRNELGGDDDGKEESDDERPSGSALSPADAVKSLRSTTLALFDELKKTTRFSISAAAIQCSNTVLKLARFLRISK